MHSISGGLASDLTALVASSRIEQLAEILGRASESSVPSRLNADGGTADSHPSVLSPFGRLRTASASIQTV